MIRASKEGAGGAMSPCLPAVLSGPILAGKENTVAIVENQRAAEIPWREGYRRVTLAGPDQGVACSASLSVIEPGAGAPTHFHNTADEVIIVIEGALEMWIGDERRIVAADHTISLPPACRMALSRSGRDWRASLPFCRKPARRSRPLLSKAVRG